MGVLCVVALVCDYADEFLAVHGQDDPATRSALMDEARCFSTSRYAASFDVLVKGVIFCPDSKLMVSNSPP